MNLTPKITFALLKSDKQYPVDFDDAIEWWDCRTKDGEPMERRNLVRDLKKDYYKAADYHSLKSERMVKLPQGGGRRLIKYYLTIECFKMMGMQVSGERGREIRRYFLDCERELERRLEAETRQNIIEAIRTRLDRILISDLAGE